MFFPVCSITKTMSRFAISLAMVFAFLAPSSSAYAVNGVSGRTLGVC